MTKITPVLRDWVVRRMLTCCKEGIVYRPKYPATGLEVVSDITAGPDHSIRAW